MPGKLVRRSVALLLACCLISPTSLMAFGQTKRKPQLPGKTVAGTLLSNGWTLTPEGRQIPISDLPLNMELSNDGRYLLVTTNGNGDQTINVIDLAANANVQTIKVKKSWLGLNFAPDGKRFYVSGGDDNEVMVYDFAGGKATEAGKINLGSSDYHKLDDKGRADARRKGTGEYAFPAGLAVTPDGKRLYVAENLSNKVAVVDLASQQVVTKIEVGEYPYDCEISKDGKRLYVSNWGSRSVAVIDPASNQVTGNIQTGDHPNDLELTKDGKTLYVANANSNTVSVIDTAQLKEIEAISTALHPKSPAGSTPNAVALSPDEKTLYVANADNNDIAVVDVAKRGASEVEGFIPTGWYPTSVRTSKDGRRIFVANGKGTASAANSKGPNPYKVRSAETEYIGSLLKGTVSLIAKPTKAKLAQLTRQTYKNSPYTDALLKAAKAPRERTAIPFRLGDASPIKHVIYIVKENRTYDQILGDMKEGNGDANLCLFGEDVTPNQHAIAREFVLLDNFYVDAEVSADGHNWSMAAYATDYVEKTWPTNYSGRGRSYDYEGQKKISRPTEGYIWDHCKRAKVSYRSYGEFVDAREGKPGGGGELGGDPGKSGKVNYTHESALEGHFSPIFPAWDLTIPDNVRVDKWLEEFRAYEKDGGLPQFQVIRLGGDHTQGTRAGQPTPRAHVAENDLAVGRLVEAVSGSERYWKDTAVFIIEDDAQNGPDHVDAHRSIAFVASAYTKRKFVDSTMYTTSGMLRTMELILGIPPMSQYDAAATPMFNSFTNKADLTPFKHRPAKTDLNEKNAPTAPRAERSAQLDFSKEDAAPDIEFNEIIWKAVRGANSQMPAPVRSAFVRAVEDDDEKEEKREKEERREVRHKTRRTK
ncbi:MAG TPA: beta-propeller fold lactonase family protein [Blastocatellia bacterium]|nr:beta-propeller fold lactonase family protein [Blastocatellia bacterium]HMV82038.1 beta-propeller fold lactonase family protein [Blastocatellia bacterium]HMX24040.1 beta-propeller fold lactonase family protein [Blastocatellia bacterium]HMZ16933.1 beta-propeller fold lactonase family protein [Blastocatellia bacterium]HNG29366.1 beta-propeller fold lactonase family protein [Blastocatellia bacterium]